jgi:hypothetical protein
MAHSLYFRDNKYFFMTTKNKALIGVASLTTLGVVIYLRYKMQAQRERQQISERVADEGYETAYDVLFPLKKNKFRRLL